MLCCWPQNTHASALVALDVCQDQLLPEKVLHLGGNKKSPRDREQSFGASLRSTTLSPHLVSKVSSSSPSFCPPPAVLTFLQTMKEKQETKTKRKGETVNACC